MQIHVRVFQTMMLTAFQHHGDFDFKFLFHFILFFATISNRINHQRVFIVYIFHLTNQCIDPKELFSITKSLNIHQNV